MPHTPSLPASNPPIATPVIRYPDALATVRAAVDAAPVAGLRIRIIRGRPRPSTGRDGRPLWLVALGGTIDAPAAPAFTEALSALAAARLDRFALDLSGVGFIGSAGLETLLDFAGTMQARGTEWTLYALRPVARPLRRLAADALLELLDLRQAMPEAGGAAAPGPVY